MSKLAIFNPENKVRSKPFPAQETIGREEVEAVNDFLSLEYDYINIDGVIDHIKRIPILSAYRGSWSKYFYGGEQVQALEKEFREKFNVKYALAVNSCTSALIVACGAIGIRPGDEVIVTPWSMTCSATAPLIYGGTPIFADIEEDYYCLDPNDIKKKITDKTKAIIVVDLFGQPFAEEIIDIAKRNGLYIIEDAAQAIGSYYHKIKEELYEVSMMRAEWITTKEKRYAGTLADIGCFSFTQGKHLTSGEGGMIVTDNDELYMKCALIRNHAESVINDMPLNEKIELNNEKSVTKVMKNYYSNQPNMVGFNMRMTEIQAVILREQLKKLDRFIKMRQSNVKRINNALKDIPAIILANKPRENCYHSYYVQGFKWDSSLANGLHRDKFIEAVNVELTGEEGREDRGLLGCGYITPLYLMPIFQQYNHWALYPDFEIKYSFFMKDGFERQKEEINNYKEGICPTVERLWKDEFFLSLYHNLPLTEKDINDISNAFHKVWENRGDLL